MNKIPNYQNIVLLPEEAKDIIKEMEKGKIPKDFKDIQVNGDEIMSLLNVKGEVVGDLIDAMRKDALMNKYDWKSKEATIEHLLKIS